MKKLLFIIFLIFCVIFLPFKTEAKFELSNLQVTNNFSLKTINGEVIKLSDLKGKPVILNFFTTWCPTCKEELPELIKFQNKYGSEYNFLSINYTIYEIGKKEKIVNYARNNHINFPILFDTTGEVGKKFGVITIPTTFFIDKNGNIVKKNIGPVTFEELEKFVLEEI